MFGERKHPWISFPPPEWTGSLCRSQLSRYLVLSQSANDWSPTSDSIHSHATSWENGVLSTSAWSALVARWSNTSLLLRECMKSWVSSSIHCTWKVYKWMTILNPMHWWEICSIHNTSNMTPSTVCLISFYTCIVRLISAIFEKIMNHLRQFYSHSTNSPTIRKVSGIGASSTNRSCYSRVLAWLTPRKYHSNDSIMYIFRRTSSSREWNPSLNGWEITIGCFTVNWKSGISNRRSTECKSSLKETSTANDRFPLRRRWLRLLFGREIPFESIPSRTFRDDDTDIFDQSIVAFPLFKALWTVIFCFDESFGFVDYFFIALLLAFGQISMWQKTSSSSSSSDRHPLVEQRGDMGHTDCLQLLMKQNMIINVEPVIRKGLSLTGRQVVNVHSIRLLRGGSFVQLQIVTERPAMLPVRRTEESQVIPVEREAGEFSTLQERTSNITV